MRVPMSWLREYVETPASTAAIAHRLVISSLEIERVIEVGVTDAGDNLGRFVVGRVISADPHPNADRLQLCQVDVGNPDPQQIVCGAWNFGAGATVAVGLPGALLPGSPGPLEERPLRGQVSQGMILAEDEIGLGADHAGIMLLPYGLEPGTPLADVLPLVDHVLDAGPTMNRPDLLSMVGIAREVAALCDGELRLPDPVDPPVVREEPVDIRVEDFEGCPRYIGRVFRDVRVGPSPQWMRTRLHLAGMRSISNVVDVTNYVMHVWGSPLHAFDRSKLAGGRIVVRRAHEGETLRTLDGTERQLLPSDLLITDGERAVALAAIMGGLDSEVFDETTEVLLEAANFEPIGVLKTSERLALRTEGSNKWEKGVDPVRGGAGGRARQPAARRSHRRGAHRVGGRAGRAARAAGRHASPGAGEPPHRARGARGRAAQGPRPSRVRGRGRHADHRPNLARARRHTRDRPRRRGRARRARPSATHDAASPRRRRAPDAAAAVPQDG